MTPTKIIDGLYLGKLGRRSDRIVVYLYDFDLIVTCWITAWGDVVVEAASQIQFDTNLCNDYVVDLVDEDE